jgi:hypothetical protein
MSLRPSKKDDLDPVFGVLHFISILFLSLPSTNLIIMGKHFLMNNKKDARTVLKMYGVWLVLPQLFVREMYSRYIVVQKFLFRKSDDWLIRRESKF